MGKDKRNLWQNITHNSVRAANELALSSQASGFKHTNIKDSVAAAIAARRAEMNKNAQISMKAVEEKKNGIAR